MAPKKDKAAPPSSKPVKSGGGKQKKKKWSKGKQKENVNNVVLFNQATYDKLLTEAPKFKLVTPLILSDRLRVLKYWFWTFNEILLKYVLMHISEILVLDLVCCWHICVFGY
ncbi:hypothetical protein UlMin_033685 [Ulmus minor]